MSVPSLLARRGRRRSFLVLVVVVSALVATACEPPPPPNPPFWHPGTTVTATVHGPLVRLAWDAPTGGNAAASYQVSLSTTTGTVVGFMPSSMRACYLRGLAASTTYTILVTARDASGEWSGPLSGTKGNRKTTVTTAPNARAGSDPWCLPTTDSDGDGLPDAFETDDGTYAHAADAGTDPHVADTDGDGITDGTETLGRPGLDLIAMGARPTHKDLLIETDWIAGASCSTQPTVAKLLPMTLAFLRAPVDNPDGVPGINLIVDHGQGGRFTGGNQVPDPDGTLDGRFTGQNVNGSSFTATKATHFDPVRKDIFHYSVTHSGHGYASTAETNGDDTYVSGGCGGSGPLHYPGVLMHEIGHNFGIAHGGSLALPGPDWLCDGPSGSHCIHKAQVNWKPNYVSVMNYRYMDGLDDSCRDKNLGSWVSSASLWLDYSSGTRAPLDENALDETVGICDGVDFDFDDDGIIDPAPYRHDATGDGYVVTPLHDHDDWGHIEATGLTEFVGDD